MMHKRLAERRIEIEDNMYKSHIGNMEVPPDCELIYNSDYEDMKSPQDLLLEAIKRYHEELEEWPLDPQVLDLPDVNFEEIRKQLKM